VVRSVLLIAAATLAAQVPGWAQEAAVGGLKGQVHTVFTEDFTSEDDLHRERRGSTLDVYDQGGYQLEFLQYEPDGSLGGHTVFSRNGPQVLKIQTMGTAPFESNSTQNVFDAEGRAVETETYDGNGVLVSKSTNELVQKQNNSATYRLRETNADGSESTAEVTETTDKKREAGHRLGYSA
jgi:hypothetical protein